MGLQADRVAVRVNDLKEPADQHVIRMVVKEVYLFFQTARQCEVI